MHSIAGARVYPCSQFFRLVTRFSKATIFSLTLLSVGVSSVYGDTVSVRDDAPSQYTVVKGDTLWGVAGRFLDDPWRWPEIWKANSHIEDPNLIFPGDVVVMDEDGSIRVLRNNKMSAMAGGSVSGRTVKLSPSIYTESLDRAIPVISPRAIHPFLTIPLVVDEKELEQYAYVTAGVDDNVILGKYQQFYARGLQPSDHEIYQIFRAGRPFLNPENDEVLGHEAIYLGDARLLEYGETSRFEILHSGEEVGPEDRLIPAPPTHGLPYYFPRSPASDLKGQIISAHEGVSELGRYSVVVVNLGELDGLESGHVLRVLRHKGMAVDPVTDEKFEVPEQSTGLLMVFRTFERLSYALVMRASRSVHLNDTVVTP